MTTQTPNRLPPAVRAGVSFGFMARRGYYASTEARAQVERMAALGVRDVALMVSVMQETWHSTRLYQDFEFTPSDQEITDIVRQFHERGIRVMLKPMVECLDGSWRGRINFPDGDQLIQGREIALWPVWFESLRRSVVHYARLAARTDCEIYCLGCELLGAENPCNNEHWRAVVAAAREAYPVSAGLLCYDAMPETLLASGGPPAWLRDLDAVCVSYYSPAADKPGASVPEMVKKLRSTVPPFRAASAALGGLPIIFGEAGCRSVHGGAITPGEYRNTGLYAPGEQANYLDAMCSVFQYEAWWGGFYWWKWDEQQSRPQYATDPAGDTGFTLAGKPAADVLRRWNSIVPTTSLAALLARPAMCHRPA
ncbi:hypothetical protein Ga0100231_010635 [Opitutaceae bacterium TAV4]|nr:hypothetical protein Ga0100231_010635 [Opitutaceae bacterium TAV4]RRJ98799.1 hypothetical protein Ga0100230_010745 [Opitutaceae bacterium TAV3]